MSKEDQSWRTAPELPTRRERIAALPEDLRKQVEDGLITLGEARNIANGLNPNGTQKGKP
jgi:hypothetical protein